MKSKLVLLVLLSAALLALATPVCASSRVFRVVYVGWEEPSGGLAEAHANSTLYLCVKLIVEEMPLARGYYGETYYSSNLPADAIYGFTATLEPLTSEVTVIRSVEAYSSPLSLGSIVELRFPVHIGRIEAGRSVAFKLTLSYEALGFQGILLESHGSQVEYINVEVTGAPKLVVEPHGSVVEGSPSNVSVIIRNIGDADARDVVVEVSGAAEPHVIRLGLIPAGGAKRFTLTAWSTSLALRVTYAGPTGLGYEESFQVALKPLEAIRSLTVEAAEKSLRAYVNNTIHLLVANTGSTELNVTLSIALSDGLAGLSARSLSLKPGEERVVEAWVYPLRSGLVAASVTVSGDVALTEQLCFVAEPPAPPQLEARAYWLSQGSHYASAPANRTGQVMVVISGKGVEDVEGYAELVLPSPWRPARLGAAVSNGEAVFSDVTAPAEPGVYKAILRLGPATVTVDPGIPGAQPYTVRIPLLELPVELRVEASPDLELRAHLEGGRLAVTIVNRGAGTARDVKVKVAAAGAAVSPSEVYVGSIAPSSEEVAYFNVSSTSPTPSFTITASYRDPVTNSEHEVTRAYSFSLPAPVVRVELLNTTLPVGVEARIALKVAVDGASIRDAVLTVSSSHLPLLGATTFTLGSLEPGKPRIVILEAYAPRDLAGAPVAIYASLRYMYAGTTRSESFDLSLVCTGVPRLDLLSAEVYPENATPGSTVSVAALLVNAGTGDAYKVFASLEDPGPFIVIGRKRMYLGDVGPGEPVSVSFRLKVPEDLEPGNYTVKARLEFQDDIGRSYAKIVEFEVQVAPRGEVVERVGAEISWQLYALIGVAVAAVAVIALPLILKRRKG